MSKNGFSFETPLKTGVQYLSRKEEQTVRARMLADQASKSAIPDMVLKPEDQALINHIRTSVQKWLAQPPAERDESLNIPGEVAGAPSTLNRYQVRLTHQIVRNEFVGLQTQGMGHFVRVTSPTKEQQMSSQLAQTEEREKTIARAVGFRWIIEALVGGNIGNIPEDYITAGLAQLEFKGQSPKQFVARLQEKLRKRKRVLIGHNCFTDLVYMYQCFIGDLPDTVEDFIDEMHILFPAIMDTKHIASFGSKRWGNTSLEDVEKELRSEQYPLIDIPLEYSAYADASSYHEAGYDSLLTANIAIRLSGKMEREGKLREKIGADDFDSMMPAFGADDMGYVTATESASSSRASSVDRRGFSEPVKTPITAIKASFDRTVKNSTAESSLITPPKSGVVAVKESTSVWKEKSEIKKLKNQMASTNIYSVLEGDAEDTMPGQEEDLMSFSSDDEELPAKGADLSAKVTKGELMPRWTMEFWDVFGNTLQVNGSKEGVCKLR